MDRFVSVVIPTLNSEGTLAECLESIFSNENPPKFEVIVVDGGSVDNTAQIAGKYPVKLLYADKPQARQRNLGISQAAGDIIAFTDSDCKVANVWLSTLAKQFDDPSVAGVGGSIMTPEDDPFWARCIGALMESRLGSAGARNSVSYMNIRDVNHNPTGNSAVRKSVLLEVGGFQDSLLKAEDVALDAKIKSKGYKLLYHPEMIVWHPRKRTLGGFAKQLFEYGRGRASVFISYPNSLPLTYFCVAAFALGTLFSVPLYILVVFSRPIILFGWIAYFLLVVLFSLYIGIKRGRLIFAIVLPVLACIEHFSLGLGFIIGLIRPYGRTKTVKAGA